MINTIDYAELTTASATAKHTLGTIYEDPQTRKRYQYVQYDTAETVVEAAANGAVGWTDASVYKVTADQSDSNNNAFAGVPMSTLSDAAPYGWIQIPPGPVTLTGASNVTMTEHNLLYWSGDNVMSEAAWTSHKPVARVDAAKPTGTVDIQAYLLP